MTLLDKSRLLQTTILGGVLFAAAPVFAQSAPSVPANVADEVIETIDEDDEDLLIDELEDDDDNIVVTGSRIRRDTFSSISPLQVISTEIAQDVGLFDPAQILQRSEAATGQQIDATFQGFVLDNGPGSQTLNLRGLGADRTLLLVNGRRLAPAGVEGAPSSPSINLLPGSLIERYDLLLDGASSIYGSDAVAGVGNVILKTDFDGFEVFGSGSINPQGAGEDYTISGSWGKNGDRGFFGVGAEYDFRDTVRLRDRDFLSGCETNYEITESGQIRTLGIGDRLFVEDRTPGVSVSDNECVIDGISGRIFLPFVDYGSVYFTPGFSNSGITDFSESTFGGVDIDADGDGLRDVDFQDVNTNGVNQDQVFISGQERVSLMAYGEYTLEGDANITPFFEALYVNADIEADNTGVAQLFPYVQGNNLTNPCNLNNNDCDAAVVALGGNPNNAGFSLPALPITAIRGDRNNFKTDLEQMRFVGGVRGDLPFLNNDTFSDWNFELSGVYSRSNGDVVRRGIREDRLAFALGIDPTADFDGDGIVDNDGDGIADEYDRRDNLPPLLGGASGFATLFGEATPCDASGLANPGLAAPDLIEGCVPVDLFAPSVLGAAIGDFATQAERDYLFGDRTFDTRYEQVVFSGVISGEVGQLGGGPIGTALGFEVRNDKIASNPDFVASNGLFFGFFSDQGAEGDKTIKELFAEVSLPLVADYPLFEELTVDLSGRFTDEEFYGSAFTYSTKAGWRPFNSLLLKASYGTSFRAPNLRENFLRAQSGFTGVFDPCAVPDDAFVDGSYNPAGDFREPFVLENCRREGRDPTRVGIDPEQGNTFQSPGVEATGGGSLDLEEETSNSFTAGFSFSQPWIEDIDLDLSVNYYEIEIQDSVIEPGAQFIVNDCFLRDDGIRSSFCDRIGVDGIQSGRRLISNIDTGFINLNEDRVEGVDYNARMAFDFTAWDEPFDVNLNLRANKLEDRSNVFVDPETLEPLEGDFAGEFGFPEWTGSMTTSLDWRDFRLTWQARYIGRTSQEIDGIDEFSDALDSRGTGFFGDTCGGPASDGVFCRDFAEADEYFTHTFALRYSGDTYTLRAGVSNAFDESPPLVSGGEGVLQIANVPIGNGYNLDGREYFFSASKRF